jgi:hypothetical protein
MDTRLRWYQRLAMGLHLSYCVWCRRYANQVRFLRRAGRRLAEDPDPQLEAVLSPEAKARLRQRLQEALKEDPPPG